jgi:glycerol-3-phosphate dehydrogenase
MSGWTKGVALPGGDFPVDGVEALVTDLRRGRPFLDARCAMRDARCAMRDARCAMRLARAYGTEACTILGGATAAADLGRDFGGR